MSNLSKLDSIVATENKIEEICSRARDAFFSESSFSKSMTVARAIKDLRAALTDEVMQDIMSLMNTSLGFRTDQDPNYPSASNPNPKPYTLEVVKECYIEATLRGFFPVNNEFNIIAGRFYGALNGFERQVRNNPSGRITDFKDTFEIPRVVNEQGAIVKCKATWKQKNDKGKFVPQELEREFAVRINRGMGSDAITGKAKRKLYAAVFSRLTGVITQDGDAADVGDLKSAAQPETPKSEDLFQKAKK